MSRAESICVAGLVGAVVVAVVLPAIHQPSAYHAFADARALGAIPNAWNVLSNLAFVAAGAAIVIGMARPAARQLPRATQSALFVAALGLLFTAAGSAYYHAQPGDATLFWDRMPITIVFAGIVGAVLAQRVSPRAGAYAAIVLLLLGPASLVAWRTNGNLMPYVVLQGAAMVALVVVVVLTPRGDDPLAWWWVIVWYGLAKLAELFDVGIFSTTGGVVSGHTLKHLFAGVAIFGLVYPLWTTKNKVGVDFRGNLL